MITLASYSSEWMKSLRGKKGYEKINPQLAEKMIHALALVELLALNKLDFVFKGGTSLVLLMEKPGRFSIDIDIITEAGRAEIELLLNEIIVQKPFSSYQLNEKRSYQPGVPKAHYSLIYTSEITGKEDHILLDILFEKHTYPKLLSVPVTSEWLQTEEPLTYVPVPTLESITGDKLTAFAPNTTGILYGKGKELEIVKQLYDLGRLFDLVTDFDVVMDAFTQTVDKEIEYRGKVHNLDNVLEDIVLTAIMIATRERNTEEPAISNFKEIRTGLLQFKAYQTSSLFRIDEAIVAAAKAAYMAALIKTGKKAAFERYEGGMQKAAHLIDHPDFVMLNKLSAEPLFYMNKVIRMLYPYEREPVGRT